MSRGSYPNGTFHDRPRPRIERKATPFVPPASYGDNWFWPEPKDPVSREVLEASLASLPKAEVKFIH